MVVLADLFFPYHVFPFFLGYILAGRISYSLYVVVPALSGAISSVTERPGLIWYSLALGAHKTNKIFKKSKKSKLYSISY